MALLLDEERFLKIKQAVEEEHNQPKAEQEEPAAQSFLLNWNFPMADNDEYTIIYRKPKAITPDLLAEEPDNSLSMGDGHLNAIPEIEKSSVENLVLIPSKFKGISKDICDVSSCDNDHFDAEFGLINSLLSQDISITSPKIDFLPEEFTEGEIDDDILQIEDEILCKKLLNVNLLIDKIEALNLTPSTPFSDFDSEGDIIFSNDLLNDDPIPEYEHFTFDIEPDVPVINNFDELNEEEYFNPGGGEIDVSQNIEDDDSFTFFIQTFLPYLTYPVDSPLLLSTGSEDTIFDPDISTLNRWHLIRMELSCALMFIQILMKARLRFSLPFAFPMNNLMRGSSQAI
ncbi:hypothetical protein Tco_1230336 [Tanacetum coccineum]